MIRVGFILNFGDKSWTGGVNYFKNLINSIANFENKKIDPVIICSKNNSIDYKKEFPGVEIIISNSFDMSSISWRISKVKQRILGFDNKIDSFLKKNRIDLISHSGHLGKRSKIPTLGWIPDFQHIRMPAFFSEKDIQERNKRFGRLCEFCNGILVSSEDARRDLLKFRSDAVDKSHVLPFVSGLGVDPTAIALDDFEKKYGISEKFFYLPNQFWVHKNHELVLRAVLLLKNECKNINIILTGNPNDVRQADHFEKLLKFIEDNKINSMVRFLGLIPYQDLVILQKYCVAIINPSLFEGWSTTVEEAKSLGKTILLSDIPVHREQGPSRGLYFDPKKERDLADLLWTTWNLHSVDVDLCEMEIAKSEFPERINTFVTTYQNIVLDIVSDSSDSMRTNL